MADAGEPETEHETIDVVTTAGELDGVVVLLREFLHDSGALRAVALFADPSSPEAPPVLIDCARLAPIEISRDGRLVHMPHAAELGVPPSAPVPDVRQLPPFEVDPEKGTVASPLGGMEHHALAVRGLAAALGEGGVALVTFQTDDAEAPLSITARVGDPIVVSLGEEEYEMEPGWPSEGLGASAPPPGQ